MFFVKDLKTGKVKEYLNLGEIYRDMKLSARLSFKDIQNKRLVRRRYVLSDSLDFERKLPSIAKEEMEFILEKDGQLEKYQGTINELSSILGIQSGSIRKALDTNQLIQRRFRLYTNEKYIKPVEGKNITLIKKKFFIFDTFFNKTKKVVTTTSEVAKMLNSSTTDIHNAIRKDYKVQGRYFIGLEPNVEQKHLKRVDARLKRSKPDMTINGDFKLVEPNKPLIKKGKLGVQGIRERLGIKEK